MAPRKNSKANYQKPVFGTSIKSSHDPKAKKIVGQKAYTTLMNLHRADVRRKGHDDFREAAFALVWEYQSRIKAYLAPLDAELTLVLVTGVHMHWSEAGDCFLETVTKLAELFGVSVAKGGDLLHIALRAYKCKRLRSSLLLPRPNWEVISAPGQKDWHDQFQQMLELNDFFIVEYSTTAFKPKDEANDSEAEDDDGEPEAGDEAADNETGPQRGQWHIALCWKRAGRWITWDEAKKNPNQGLPAPRGLWGHYEEQEVKIKKRWPPRIRARTLFYYPTDRLKKIIKKNIN